MAADLECRGVTKRYWRRRALAPGAPWRERMRHALRSRDEFWALRDVSFDVPKGEALGIIGHNGAGKSTLLKILSRITPPSAGEIRVHGRLAGLIELSAGFHPELTGRENALLSGVILGMSRREARALLPAIAEFSGLGDFLDTPVKQYSSGMYVRLGFAIAAHLEPDILLLDEVLAVGDVGFQHKCLRRVRDLKAAGTTIILISHDLAAIERLCDRVLLMERGRVVLDGPPGDVTFAYQQSALEHAEPPEAAATLARTVTCRGFTYGPGGAEGSSPSPQATAPPAAVRSGGPMTIGVEYLAQERLEGVVFTVRIFWPSGWLCTDIGTGPSGVTVEPGCGRVEFAVPIVTLCAGMFLVDLVIERPPVTLDLRRRCATLHVLHGEEPVMGDVYMPSSTRVFTTP